MQAISDYFLAALVALLLLVATLRGPEDPNPPAGSSPAVVIPYPHLLSPPYEFPWSLPVDEGSGP